MRIPFHIESAELYRNSKKCAENQQSKSMRNFYINTLASKHCRKRCDALNTFLKITLQEEVGKCHSDNSGWTEEGCAVKVDIDVVLVMCSYEIKADPEQSKNSSLAVRKRTCRLFCWNLVMQSMALRLSNAVTIHPKMIMVIGSEPPFLPHKGP